MPNREAAACAGPGTAANNPDTNPTSLSSQPPGRGHLADRGPAERPVRGQALPVPVVPVADRLLGQRPGAERAVQRRHQLRREPHRQPRQPEHGPGPRPAEAPAAPRPSAGSPRTTAATRTTRSARATTCPARSTPTARRTTHSPTPYDPESTTPKNFTGGLYASDLFLEYYIPLIEQSPAFKQGGLIDVTFDEGVPAVHLHRQQLQQRQRLPAHLGGQAELHQLDHGRHGGREPVRPERQLRADRPELDARHRRQGRPALPRPRQQRLRRPAAGVYPDQPDAGPADCVPGIVRGGAGSPPARADRHRHRRHRVERHHRRLDRWPTTPAAR